MGNVYMFANNDGKLVETTDAGMQDEYDCEFITHRAANADKAEEFNKKSIHPHTIATWFCGGCGEYIGIRNSCDCGCYRPQGAGIEPAVVEISLE